MSIRINAREVGLDVSRERKKYIVTLKKSLVRTINDIRKRAADVEILPNTSGVLNQSAATRKQPSTAGRLTSREGKLSWSLKQKLKTNWEGYNKKLTKLDLDMLKLQVKTNGNKDVFDFVSGSIRLKSASQINLSGRLTSQYKGMRKGTPLTMRMRYIWEYASLDGNGKRPFLEPAARFYAKSFRNRVSLDLKGVFNGTSK